MSCGFTPSDHFEQRYLERKQEISIRRDALLRAIGSYCQTAVPNTTHPGLEGPRSYVQIPLRPRKMVIVVMEKTSSCYKLITVYLASAPSSSLVP